MKRKFISVLGAGTYYKCVYFNGNEKVETRFIQEALIEMYMKNATEDDEIVIFITPKARENNWEDGYIKKKGIKSRLSGLPDEKIAQVESILGKDEMWEDKEIKVKGLKRTLEERYPNVKIREVEIKEGSNEDELWDTFDKILNVIEDNDNIIFDITHSFRSIPMQVLAVLNYASVIYKNVKLLGIYYGAYEAKTGNEAPVFNLNIYNDILKWTSASKNFINYGNSNEICDLYKEKIEEGHKELKVIEKFIKALKAFTNNISTCRGKIITKAEAKNYRTRMDKSIYEAAVQIQNNFHNVNNLNEKTINSIKPFEKLLDKIKESLSDFNEESNFKIGLATIKWCQKNALIQNAYTAIDETIKTYVCDKYRLDNTTEKNRDFICKAAMVNILRERKNEKVNLNISDESDIRIYNLIKETLPMDIVKLSKKVSNFRNDINHFGFLNKSSSYITFRDKLDGIICELFTIIDKYKDVDFFNYQEKSR